ncbi:MAG: DMT family transporter [Acidobacteriota bacterium]
MRSRSILEIHVAVFFFGTAGLFGKWLTFSPFLIVLGRVIFASLTLFLILYFSKRSFRLPYRKTSFLFLSLGGLLAVHWAAFFHAIQVSTVAVGLLSFSTFPVFTVFLEPLFFRKKIQWKHLSLAFLCLLGVYLILPGFKPGHHIFQGVFWGVFSGLTFALLAVINRRLSQDFSSLLIAFYQDLSASLILLPAVFLVPIHFHPQDILLLVVLGVVCTALSHTLFIKGMKYIEAQKAAIISTLEPVYGVILAFLLLSEIPMPQTLIGGTIILFSALAVTIRRK